MSNDNLKADNPNETVKETVARLNALVLEKGVLIAAAHCILQDAYALLAVAFMVKNGGVFALCKKDNAATGGSFEVTARYADVVLTLDGEKVYDYFQRKNSSSKS